MSKLEQIFDNFIDQLATTLAERLATKLEKVANEKIPAMLDKAIDKIGKKLDDVF